MLPHAATKSMIKYTSYKNLRNLLGQLLSRKISCKIQFKNLNYLTPQSLACEVYRKQENEVKDLLPQSRRTRKINDKMQQRLVKSLFSQLLLRQINDKMLYKTKYNIFCCSQSRAKSQIKRKKSKKTPILYIRYTLSLIWTVQKKISFK